MLDSLDILTFFKRCHRPLYYKAKLNQLRNGERLSLGGVRQSTSSNHFLYAQASLQKETRGQFSFHGLWTLNDEVRWTQGHFTLGKGQLTFSSSTSPESLDAFYTLCQQLLEAMKPEEKRYIQSIRSKGQSNWFHQHQLPVCFDGLVVTPSGVTKEALILSADQYWNRKPLKLSSASLDAIHTHPLNALRSKYETLYYGQLID